MSSRSVIALASCCSAEMAKQDRRYSRTKPCPKAGRKKCASSSGERRQSLILKPLWFGILEASAKRPRSVSGFMGFWPSTRCDFQDFIGAVSGRCRTRNDVFSSGSPGSDSTVGLRGLAPVSPQLNPKPNSARSSNPYLKPQTLANP